jgi:hypothetical protein
VSNREPYKRHDKSHPRKKKGLYWERTCLRCGEVKKMRKLSQYVCDDCTTKNKAMVAQYNKNGTAV